MLAAILISLAAGAGAGWYFTKSGYDAKLKAIADEIVTWEGHRVAEVRTLVARVKSFL